MTNTALHATFLGRRAQKLMSLPRKVYGPSPAINYKVARDSKAQEKQKPQKKNNENRGKPKIARDPRPGMCGLSCVLRLYVNSFSSGCFTDANAQIMLERFCTLNSLTCHSAAHAKAVKSKLSDATLPLSAAPYAILASPLA